MLEVGDLAPETSLTDQDGRPLDLREWRGHALILAFELRNRAARERFAQISAH